MRPLIISLFLLLVSCAPYPGRMGYIAAEGLPTDPVNPYFSDSSRDYVYRMDVRAFDNVFTGMLIVKKVGPARHRVVGTAQAGNTLFDFEISGTGTEVVRLLPPLDRRRFRNLLGADLRVLVTENPPVSETWDSAGSRVYRADLGSGAYYYATVGGQLEKITRVKNHREISSIRFDGVLENIAAKCRIEHSDLDLVLVLTLM